MHPRWRRGRRLAAAPSLTQQVALLSLIPIVALGFVLARELQARIVARALADAGQSAQLIAHIGIQSRLSQNALSHGLSASGIRALDQALSGRSTTSLARIKVWNSHDVAIYSDDHSIIGRTLPPSDELLRALAGRPPDARVITPKSHGEQASELGLGQLVEVYTPLRIAGSGPPEGAFEIYLHYQPIAAAIARDKRTIAVLVGSGLAVQSSLESMIALDDVALNVEASIGIAVMGEHAETPDALLQRADAALARAKAHRSRVEVFSPGYDSFDPGKLLLLGQVRQALEQEQFILHYQPQLELGSGRIAGVEALLRWRHPQRGLLAPMTFIPLVEQTALIAPLALYVLTHALRQAAAWRELGLELQMSINLSA